MPATSSSPVMSPPLRDSVETNVDAGAPSARASREIANREAWQDLIDHQLVEWGWDVDRFEDEGIEPPTRETVQLAIAVASALRDDGLAPPTCVVPDVNGGIVFERRVNGEVEIYHIWDDGMVEYQQVHGTQIVKRRRLSI